MIRDPIRDLQEWMETYLRNWSYLFESKSYDSVIVMESVLIQIPILNLLNKDMGRETIISFIHKLDLMLSEYQASLFLFCQEDSDAAIDDMVKSRGGAHFLAQKYEEFKNENYYVHRDQTGPALHLDFLKEYAEISKELLNKISIDTRIIENSKKEWPLYEQQLLRRYNLEYYPDPYVTAHELAKLV